jgi:hypothetical protein
LGNGGITPPFLTSVLDGDEWSTSRPCRFIPRGRRFGIHWIEGWMGPRAGLDAVPFLAPTGVWGIHETFRFTSVSLSGTVGRTPWTSDQLIARPTYTEQHKHRINVQVHINIHASSRIRAYDPSIQASQDSSCLIPLGYRDRLWTLWRREKSPAPTVNRTPAVQPLARRYTD